MVEDKASLKGEELPLTKTILIVEDEADFGEILVEVLVQETPYQVVLITESCQVGNVLKEITPILFLLDYRPPRMDGLALYDRLHATPGLEAIPTIIMSIYSRSLQPDIAKRHLVLLRKPFDLDEFLRTIKQALASCWEENQAIH